LSKIPVQYVVGTGPSQFAVNIPLVQSTANNNWLDLGFSFTVVNTRGGALCPSPIPDIPLVDAGATGRMLQIFMGQHFFQCAMWVNYNNGVLDVTIPSNATDWWMIIPQIPTKWPGAGLKLRVTMYKLGAVAITPSGMTAELPLSINITVQPQTGGPPVHAAALSATSVASIRVWIGKDATNHPTIYLNVTSLKLTFGVIDSAVGPIDLGLLQGLTDIIVPILVQAIDEVLKKGFIIPISKGLGLTNDVIVFSNGYLAIEADFVYTFALPNPDEYDYPRVAEDPMDGDDVIRGVA